MKPYAQIKTAKENLLLAAAEWAAVKNGLITKKNLPDVVNWTLDSGETVNITTTVENSQLELYFTNQLRAAFAISYIQADTALEQVFGKQRLEDEDSDRRASRCIIYMLRCSLAHNPLEPVWVCNRGFRECFSVKAIDFTLDIRNLDGEPVSWEQFGGIPKYFGLLDYCESLVK